LSWFSWCFIKNSTLVKFGSHPTFCSPSERCLKVVGKVRLSAFRSLVVNSLTKIKNALFFKLKNALWIWLIYLKTEYFSLFHFFFSWCLQKKQRSHEKKTNQSKVRRQFDNVRPRSWLVKLSSSILMSSSSLEPVRVLN
jgi:hypothetical protein